LNMSGNLFKKTALLPIIFILLAMSTFIYADPRILSVTLNPPNPTFGQTATLTVNYCGDSYNSIWLSAAISTLNTYTNPQISGTGQWFVVSPTYPTNVQKVAPGASIGYQIRAGLGTAGTCTDCGGTVNATLGTWTGTITIPNASDFPGCNISQLYLLIRMGQSNLNEGSWITPQACAPNSSGYISPGWAIPTPDCDFTLHKRAEGVLAVATDLLLYSIDYTYSNGKLTITDQIPSPSSGAFTLVSVGPASMWTGTPAIGTIIPPASGTVTWNLPDRSGQPGTASGTVWFLLRMSSAITPGTKITNSATGTITGASCALPSQTVKTDIIVGQAVATLTKSARSASVNYHDTITYYLDYEIKGSRLVAYQPFDDITAGTYTGTPPTGWNFIPNNGDNGTWQVYDECGTGDYIIKGSAQNNDYPGMTLKTPQFCTGMIVTDVLISANYEGADALIVIRNNNLASPNNKAYALVVSVDDTPANLAIQICSPSCSWPATGQAHGLNLLSNTWFRVRINVLSDCHFQAKIWKRGDPEPGAYQIDYNEGTCSMACTDPADPTLGWTPGIAEQGGASKVTNDEYNNFIVYQPLKSLDTTVYDTIPPGVSYAGAIGSVPIATNPVVKWSLGPIQDSGGSLTWLAQVNTCDAILNTGTITGTGIVPVDSNVLEVDPICAEVSGLTKTATTAGPVMIGDTITWVIKYCNDGVGVMHNYIVTDPVPAGMNCQGCLGGCTGCPGTGTITWSLGDIPIGVCNQSLTWWGKVTTVP
jgi:uncharacterized repeat protein (TIGR01451 family)